MIDLLGIGVEEGGRWRLRRVCARIEARGLTAVLASRPEQRLTLLDVVAGRVVPSEGRAWIGGTPLRPETASRIRRRTGIVDVRAPLGLEHALRDRPERLIVAEPDAVLGREEVDRLLRRLRSLALRDRLSILVSLADGSLGSQADTTLTIAGGDGAPFTVRVEAPRVLSA